MRIFAADIGGSNSRFGLFEGTKADSLRCVARCTLSSAVHDFAEQLALLRERCPEITADKADRALLAVAGPVLHKERVRPSNLPYEVTASALRLFNPSLPVSLINDFSAQAGACLSPLARGFLPLTGQTGTFDAPALCALTGAGTGLGSSFLLTGGGKSVILPSENGHNVFAFRREEQDFALFAGRKVVHGVQNEDLLSGAGLSLIHEYVTGRKMRPEVITAEPSFPSSATCALFARCYGRVCRQLALTLLPSDMVITGGLAQHAPSLIRHPAFLEEFYDLPSSLREVVATVRLWHNSAADAGLWGAAGLACGSCGEV